MTHILSLVHCRRSDIDPGAVDIARARLAFWTPERHRLALRDAESLRAAVRETGPDAGPQLDLFGGGQ